MVLEALCVLWPVSGACAWDTCIAEAPWEKALSTARPPSVSVGAEAYITAWGLGYIMWPATEVGTDDVTIVAGRLTVAKRMDKAEDGQSQIKKERMNNVSGLLCAFDLLTQGGSVAQRVHSHPSPPPTLIIHSPTTSSDDVRVLFTSLNLFLYLLSFCSFYLPLFLSISLYRILPSTMLPSCISPFQFLLCHLFRCRRWKQRSEAWSGRKRCVVWVSLSAWATTHCLPVHLMASSPIWDTTQDPRQCWTSCFNSEAKRKVLYNVWL